AQLAYVARPAVAVQRLHGRVRERRAWRPRDLAREVLDQGADVLRALAQRRDVDARHREPEIEIGPEGPLIGLGAQVAVGRGDDADVDLDVLLAADAAERPPLEDAEQGRLDRQRQLADLVEEDRSAVRELEGPLLAALGAGE